LLYVDRKDEKLLIKTGGENVYPQEVEAALQAHPDVAESCVIGVPDSEWGEAVRAVVVIRAGASADAEALADFCAERIARYKRPRSVAFADALPRSEQGVLDRREVRRRFGTAA
jgi:acyl-CoA synthetase (AMP-forming)/AMP-acid ligase II